ncbi:pyridoxamine 5'-phosphate oxidase [Synergistales bacterium]|nr:pyridoxamine 5'-phosphate oxidase [Synergistales bacterium]
MSKVVELLQKSQVFHFATVDGDKPRVRPFGFVMDFEGKLYFATANSKDVYKQMKVNPNVEMSGMLENGSWIRLSGKAVLGGNAEAKRRAFEVFPRFKDIYQSPENPAFEVFYLDSPSAFVYPFTGTPEKIL